MSDAVLQPSVQKPSAAGPLVCPAIESAGILTPVLTWTSASRTPRYSATSSACALNEHVQMETGVVLHLPPRDDRMEGESGALRVVVEEDITFTSVDRAMDMTPSNCGP